MIKINRNCLEMIIPDRDCDGNLVDPLPVRDCLSRVLGSERILRTATISPESVSRARIRVGDYLTVSSMRMRYAQVETEIREEVLC